MIKIKNYILQQEIGHGKYGKVYKGKKVQTEECVAIKKIQKSMLTNDIFRELVSQEISCMKLLQEAQLVTPNENIVQFIEFIESPQNYYIIMEYCNGKDLKQLLEHNDNFSESEAIQKFQQLLNGLKLLVDNQIMHRDLKSANIFLHNNTLKIGDFGFACQSKSSALKLGTPLYMAPELLNCERYDNKVDVWALGVIFYQLLFGIFPFKTDKENQLEIYETTNPDYNYNNIQISSTTKALLEQMLTFRKEDRISWDQLFNSNLGIHQLSQEKTETLIEIKVIQATEEEEEIQGEIAQLFTKTNIHTDRNERQSPQTKNTTDNIKQLLNCEVLSNMNSHCSFQTSCSEMRKISQQTFDLIIQDDYDLEI